VLGHEVDGVRRRHLCRDDEVAFIFAVVIIDENEHAAVASLVDDRLGPDQHLGIAALEQFLEPAERVGGWVPVRGAELAQAVGVEARRAGEAGAADLAGFDDSIEAIHEGSAHESP
jgi:hypothetical protein